MEIWTSHNRPALQRAAAVGIVLAGLVLVAGGERTGGLSHPATLLGSVLVLLGLVGMVVAGRQTVTVDPGAGTVTIEDAGPVGTRRRVIAFDEIDDVRVAWTGTRANLVGWYYLALRLRGDRRVALFAPGRFYRGASDRHRVAQWRERLLGAIRAHHGEPA